MAYSTSIADNAHQSVAGQKRTANVEQSTSLLSNLMGETTVTQRWVVCLNYEEQLFINFLKKYTVFVFSFVYKSLPV